jgi:hypothetical protein
MYAIITLLHLAQLVLSSGGMRDWEEEEEEESSMMMVIVTTEPRWKEREGEERSEREI